MSRSLALKCPRHERKVGDIPSITDEITRHIYLPIPPRMLATRHSGPFLAKDKI